MDGVVYLSVLLQGGATVSNNFTKQRQNGFKTSKSLRSIWKLSMQSCCAALSLIFCFLRPATLAFVSFFVLAILPDMFREKPSYGKIVFTLKALLNTRVLEIRA